MSETRIPYGTEVRLCRYDIPCVTNGGELHYEIKTVDQIVSDTISHYINKTIHIELYFEDWSHPTKDELDYFEMMFDKSFRTEFEKLLSKL